jgi:zinc transporter 1/2/3
MRPSLSPQLRKRVAVMVLECGIAVHSVIIGLTLGVQPDGSNFTALLIALSFHQFFEVLCCVLKFHYPGP